jgi:DNA-binding transcriptional LysR family regulator
MLTEAMRVFCDVVETKSFTATARKHGVTQSAVTQMFHGLEQQFKARFAIRKPKGFRLTPAGEAFYAVCRRVLRLEARLCRRMQATRAARARVIQLAACHTVGLHQLPGLLTRFRGLHPAIDVRDRYHLVREVHERVLDNLADLGLLCYPRPRRGLVVDLLHHDRMMTIFAPQHPLATRAAITPPELKGEKLVGWDAVHASPFLHGLPGRQRRLFRPHHEFDEVESVKCQVEGGHYIAILPESAVQAEVASHRLAAVPFQNAGCTEPLGLIYRKNKILTPAMTTFI